MSDKNRRVVVTGMGALTPIGLTVNEFWNGMMDCKSGAAMIKQFDTSKIETKFSFCSNHKQANITTKFRYKTNCRNRLFRKKCIQFRWLWNTIITR